MYELECPPLRWVMVIQFKYVNPHCPFRNLLWISHGNSQRYYLPYPFIITMPVRGRRNLVQGRVLKHRRKVVSIRFDYRAGGIPCHSKDPSILLSLPLTSLAFCLWEEVGLNEGCERRGTAWSISWFRRTFFNSSFSLPYFWFWFP